MDMSTACCWNARCIDVELVGELEPPPAPALAEAADARQLLLTAGQLAGKVARGLGAWGRAGAAHRVALEETCILAGQADSRSGEVRRGLQGLCRCQA